MYELMTITMYFMAFFLFVVVLFSTLGRYGGCKWYNKGGCVKCDRGLGHCFFTGVPTGTMIVVMSLIILGLYFARPDKPAPVGMTNAQYKVFAKMNGMSGKSKPRADKEAIPEPAPVVETDLNGTCEQSIREEQ